MGFLRKFSIVVVLFIALFIGFVYWNIRRPGSNGMGFLTTAEEAVKQGYKLKGKNILITGGHSGIGMSTVEALAPYKPNIWILIRNNNNGIQRCQQFATALQITSENPNIFCEETDLCSLDSVVDFSKRWKIQNRPIHLLILNAGVSLSPYSETVDGFQLIWQTNHLGHFLLTNLLLENLKLGKPCRVVVVSSGAHFLSSINWDDISGNNTWYSRDYWTELSGGFKAYGQSKTANILFANELNEILKGYGVANSLHPGLINTPLVKSLPGFLTFLTSVTEPILVKTASQGAATTVYVATDPELENRGGEYFEDCNVAPRAIWASDKANAKRLWDISLSMVRKWLP